MELESNHIITGVIWSMGVNKAMCWKATLRSHLKAIYGDSVGRGRAVTSATQHLAGV
jgi:hypothetical protein